MTANWGHTLDSAVIERGLRELNAGIHFDMGTKLNQWHPYQKIRQGVYYDGRHLCSMDRGIVPEYKQWSVAERVVPVPFDRCEDDDVTLQYQVLSGGSEEYNNLYVEAALGRVDNMFIRPDGKLVRLQALKKMKVRNRVILVGWRHTFERILAHNIPGVTRASLNEKFGVDMLKYPVGPPEEVMAELVEE